MEFILNTLAASVSVPGNELYVVDFPHRLAN